MGGLDYSCSHGILDKSMARLHSVVIGCGVVSDGTIVGLRAQWPPKFFSNFFLMCVYIYIYMYVCVNFSNLF